MSKLKIRAVTRTQGNSRALKDGDVAPLGIDLEFEEVPVLVTAFRRMVRELAYDVCEMALTTYVCAREHGVKFTALPIFLVRDVHHGAIRLPERSAIVDGRELEGSRVGVNRGYTVTTGVWARAILQDECGVDLSKVTWMPSGDEHVEAYRPPANVEPLAKGADLATVLAAGDVDAAVGDLDAPGTRMLLDDPLARALRAYDERGFYPINHLIVVRDDMLDTHPSLGAEIFDLFVQSKVHYLDELKRGGIAEPTKTDRLHQAILARGDNPLPYGIEPNRRMLEELLRHARTQEIVRRPVTVDELFWAGTREATG